MIIYLVLIVCFLTGLYFMVKGMRIRNDTTIMVGLLIMLFLATAIIAIGI